MTDHVWLDPPGDPTTTSWWDRYANGLPASITPTARGVLDADCRYIVEQGIFGNGTAGGEGWPATRLQRGLVMGSVQSGKTASMLGVTALALDSQVDIVVILAGTRVALWRQTYERAVQQLRLADNSDELTPCVLLPQLSLAEADADARPSQLFNLNGARVRRALDRRIPIIAVVMKNTHHLHALSRMIQERVIPEVQEIGRPVHILVLDDEADDGSILDARVEETLDPVFDDFRQVPSAIVDLWERRPHAGSTSAESLYATYVAYTATPQANLLQAAHNPLAPKDFVVALRTPFDTGVVAPRSTTYFEPNGYRSYYSGGETFYRRLGEACDTSVDHDDQETLGAALRAYLIAVAIRLWRSKGALSLGEAGSASFSSAEEALRRSPLPTTMLYHPSASVADHFAAAATILAWAGDLSQEEAMDRITAGERNLPREALCQDVTDQPDAWIAQLGSYVRSAAEVVEAFDLLEAPSVPAEEDWETIQRILCDDVIPNVSISIVNSDPASDDRPEFAPVQQPDATWRCPRDLATIFVSGNVMSRGLTLEGLVTSLFLRRAGNPYADTQMQMQRWFGYRGPHLELCRIFVPAPQLDLFKAYHEADEALRREVIRAMNIDASSAPSPQVLQGQAFAATGKLTNIGSVPLCPGPSPFIRIVNSGQTEDPNAAMVAQLFKEPSSKVVAHGTPRGRVLDRTLSLVEAAELLEGLRYDQYRPAADRWETDRWQSLEAHLGLDPSSDLSPLYRSPGRAGSAQRISAPRQDSPYAIGAYLRLWAACLTHRARGLFPTEDPLQPWSMVDLEAKAREQPRFYVGIRFGSVLPVTDGPLAELDFEIKPMVRSVNGSVLESTWGSRNPGEGPEAYLGDAWFDYHVHKATAPTVIEGEPRWRPVGAPGLILFHIVAVDGWKHPVVAAGLGIPLGGPDQFAAWNPQRMAAV